MGTTSAGTGSSVTVTGLKNGTPVYSTVTARSLLIATTSERSNTITPAGPPFAPTGLRAERGDQRIHLKWDPPGPRPDGTPGDNGDPITSYTVSVFRAEDNALVETIEGANSPQEVGGLTNGAVYYFTVRATNGVGTGPDSGTSNHVTPAGRPAAPTNVAAMARHNDAAIGWAAADNNGSPITGYTVIASDGRRQTVPNGVMSTAFGSLEEGVSYTFTVVAINDVGESDPSAPSSAVVVTKIPGAAGSPTATAGVGNATVSWVPADPNGTQVLSYTISTDEGHVVRVPGDAISATVSGLSPGSFHVFYIFATNYVGDGPTNVSNAVQVPANPNSPFHVSAEAIQGGADLRWVAPSSGGSLITNYTITASPGGAQTTVPNDFGAEEYPYTTLLSLDPNTTYTFTVVATNEAGDSSSSEPSNAIRPLTERQVLRQQADAYMMSPLSEFLVTKSQQPGPFDWSDNGCSFPFDYPTLPQFHEPCQRHDFGYRNYGRGPTLAPDEGTRRWIDDRLLLDMVNSCNGDSGCLRAANDTYIGLRLFGESFYA